MMKPNCTIIQNVFTFTEETEKLPEIQLSREQQKAEMQELIKLIEKKKPKPKPPPLKKVSEGWQ